MEDLSPTDLRLQRQPMYESDVENLGEEIQEVSQQVPAKSQDSSNKMLIGTRSDILLLESNILQLELNLEIFCQTSLTLELTKMTFIMKILTWMSTCFLLKI